MTREEARKEAQRRWGAKGRVQLHPFHHYTHQVGYAILKKNGSNFWVMGWGTSYENAFADVDRRAQSTAQLGEQ